MDPSTLCALDVFPNLKYAMTITSGSFRKYVPRVRKLLGKGVALLSIIYGSSESGLSALNMRLVEQAYVKACRQDAPPKSEYIFLVGNLNVLEWIDTEQLDDDNPPLHAHHELKVNRQYELVLTNSCGLFRYRTGDLFTVLRHWGASKQHP